MTAPRDPNPDEDQDERELERRLEKQHRLDLPGDMEENRNLSGSTTWETLEEEAGNTNIKREPREGED